MKLMTVEAENVPGAGRFNVLHRRRLIELMDVGANAEALGRRGDGVDERRRLVRPLRAQLLLGVQLELGHC